MTQEELFEQLLQYLCMLTENRLVESYGEELGKDLSNTFQIKFRELLAANEELTPDALGKRHAVNPLFVIALNDTLGDERGDFHVLREHVLEIYKVMLEPILVKQTEHLEVADDVWSAFVESTRRGNKANYENDYFQLQEIESSGDTFRFDINRCIYFEIFQKNEHPELGPILCDYDYLIAGAVDKWIRFDRSKTIANGDSRCDFGFFLK
ncbi:MAG: L-2-amino-thiazoline-4-carboxylic acid hydrolase [Candidatus Thorarchaeota archaeon]|nr:MAG: L-2-amino-thiazoline-4-carboxylic acid hydrolase [Candidatus Thorarchaeota archaeon]